MYHHSDRKNRLFVIGYIPIQSIRFCIPKLPCGGRSCSRIISHLQWAEREAYQEKKAAEHDAANAHAVFDELEVYAKAMLVQDIKGDESEVHVSAMVTVAIDDNEPEVYVEDIADESEEQVLMAEGHRCRSK